MKEDKISKIISKWLAEQFRLQKASKEALTSIEKITFQSVAEKIGEFIKDLQQLES